MRRLKRTHLGMILLAMAIVAAVAVGAWVHNRFAQFTLEEVVPGKVYRSGQPSASDLRDWVARYRLQTVFNLRGDLASARVREEAALAEELHVAYVSVDLAAWKWPRKRRLLNLIDSLEKAKPPILVHCHHGVDRSGLVSMLAAWTIGGQDYATARRQLYVPTDRDDDDDPHISDVILDYEQDCEQDHVAPGDWGRFKTWVRDHYQGRGSADEPVSSQ